MISAYKARETQTLETAYARLYLARAPLIAHTQGKIRCQRRILQERTRLHSTVRFDLLFRLVQTHLPAVLAKRRF